MFIERYLVTLSNKNTASDYHQMFTQYSHVMYDDCKTANNWAGKSSSTSNLKCTTKVVYNSKYYKVTCR